MAFEWRKNLELARQLAEQANSGTTTADPEALLRCAIGRAYFGAYGHAHRFALAWLGFQSRVRLEEKSQDHGRLRAYLMRKRRARVAECLEFLREMRNRSDYEGELEFADLNDSIAAVLGDADYVFRALVPPATGEAAS